MQWEKGISAWKQISDDIETSIKNKTWKPGDKLPTEMELAKTYRVNRHTIRRSVHELVEKGLISVEQGRGMFIPDYVLDYKLAKRTRFSEVVSSQNKFPGGRILSGEVIKANKKVSEALKMPLEGKVCLLRTIRELDGVPIVLAAHYFSASRFPDFLERFEEFKSVSKTLDSYGLGNYERQSTNISARMPNSEEIASLKQPANRPVLITESVNVDSFGEPIEFGISAFSADRTNLIVES
ncbi:MAG: phosphonate metabolism transcriptional regulator PhnF [Rhodospirillaceae bacterium]|nr:phosphonate metabolism transcriptional regulator PhnF [Rhodospirillaceae bacterium]|tara:strand:- start:3646 stop:4362 length:717 start_codon:yes stop_codon:yes gene_type:complete